MKNLYLLLADQTFVESKLLKYRSILQFKQLNTRKTIADVLAIDTLYFKIEQLDKTKRKIAGKVLVFSN